MRFAYHYKLRRAEQINAALAYIEANRITVEAEYQMVLKEAEELRLYYEEKKSRSDCSNCGETTKARNRSCIGKIAIG